MSGLSKTRVRSRKAAVRQPTTNLSHAVGAPLAGHLLRKQSLAQLLLEAARTQRGVVFIQDDETELRVSYAQLLQRAERRLGGLHAHTVRAGETALIAVSSNLEFAEVFWACVLGGIIAVPVTYPASLTQSANAVTKLHTIWEQLQRPVVITDLRLGQHLQQQGEARDVMRLLTASTLDAPPPPFTPGSDEELAFIQYSSGSTSAPKGVALSHRNLLANLEAMLTHVEVGPQDVYLSWMPYSHDMGLIGLHMAPLAAGVEQVNLSAYVFARRPLLWLEKVHQHRATLTGSPNFGYRLVLDRISDEQLRTLDLSCLRVIFNGAEPIAVPVMREFVQTLAACKLAPTAMYPVYGMAEACVALSFPPLASLPVVHSADRRALAESGRVLAPEDSAQELLIADEGSPIPGCELRVVDAQDQLLPEGCVGHVQIRGMSVTRGYYRNPEANQTLFVGDWLRTGDLGFMLKGRISITGRAKDIVIINGQKSFAYDIEQRAEQIHGIRAGKVAVCGWHDAASGQEKVVMFAATQTNGGKSPQAILAAVWKHINAVFGIPLDYMVPVKNLPRTTSGKLQRYQMLSAFLQGKFADSMLTPKDLFPRLAAPLVPAGKLTETHKRVRRVWAEILDRPATEIALDQPFMTLGGTSLRAVQSLGLLEEAFSTRLTHELLLQCRTIDEIALYLMRLLAPAKPTTTQSVIAVTPSVKQPQPELDQDIAIIGMACRFPGADSPEAFWQNLMAGKDCITEIPLERWNADAFYEAGRPQPGRTNSRWGGFLDSAYGFDAAFFHISDAEAAIMDPQQRLFLQTSWHTLENAGYSGSASDGARIGVVVGASHNNYFEHYVQSVHLQQLRRFTSFNALPAPQQEALLGEWRRQFGAAEPHPNIAVNNLLNMIAARTSHVLNLKGPSLSIDTACSSSLVAVHLACESLRRGECEMALAGGVNLNLSPTPYLLFAMAGALSPSGRCRAFDADADGFVPGEGVGAVLLKPLQRALADRDNVLAVIRRSAINNDGRSIGVMAPNPDGQRLVIAGAYRDTQLAPRDIQYVEAHGTGTAIGDLSEIRALSQAFSECGAQPSECAIGSVKSNIGHLLSAAGIASLIKMVLALQHREMPPSIHLRKPNPQIDFERTPFRPLTQARPWDVPQGKARRAAINSFGFGGTNCHMILEEAPPAPAAANEGWQLICLSAPHAETLQRRAHDLAAHIVQHPLPLPDLAYTLHTGRKHFEQRCAVVADSTETLAEKLVELGEPVVVPRAQPAIALLFTGQGAQFPGMAQQLFESLPRFRRIVEECAAAFDPYFDEGLLAHLFGAASSEAGFAQTKLTQALVFTVDYSIGRLLLEWGIKPSCMLGHSVGEYAAACLAGVLSLTDSAKLIAARGRLINALPAGGGMTAVFMTQQELEPLLAQHPDALWFAAHNGTHQVVSGTLEALADLQQRLQGMGKTCRALNVSHAFHTPLLQPMVAQFERVLAEVQFAAPAIPLISNVDGAWHEARVLDARYWREHLLAPVRFEHSVRCAAEHGVSLFLECGPDKTLSNLARAILAGRPVHIYSALDRKRDDVECLLSSLGGLWQHGAGIDWQAFHAQGTARRRALPGLAFRTREYRLVAPDADRDYVPEPVPSPASSVSAAATPASNTGSSAPESSIRVPQPPVLTSLGDWHDIVPALVAESLHITAEQVDMFSNFADLGMSSAAAVELAERLGKLAGATLSPTMVFEHQTPDALADHLRINHSLTGPSPDAARANAPTRGALRYDVPRAALQQFREHDIAIIGMSCRLPGADTLEEFWKLLLEGRSQIREITPQRWSADDYFDADSKVPYASYSKWAAILERPFDFDPMFFGISPREAEAMDPQQRLFLEVAWEALQQSGYGGDFRTKEIGVFVGCEQNHYGEHFVTYHRYAALRRRLQRAPWFGQMGVEAQAALFAELQQVLQPAELIPDAVAGQGLNEVAARMNHWLDLRGPSLMVNTACSSSLVALHLACESLRSGESRMAIVGGVYLTGNDTPFVFLSRVGALSPTGACTPFDARANGMVLGEGVSAVILKPLKDAIREGDHIHAVIKGSAINNDGHSNGITAPNPRGQADAIRKAYHNAGLTPESIGYIECHGTGTPLGDPVEIEGMTQAFRKFTDRNQFCGIGSLKSLLGHMLSGSSLPALIKVALSLQHRVLPPNAGFERANPHIDFARSPFYMVAGSAQPWTAHAGQPRRAGVNSFGFGGTNCHVVLEEAPVLEPTALPAQGPHLLLLTGRSQRLLQQVAARLQTHLEQHAGIEAAHVCLSMNAGQRDLPFKAALVAQDRDDLRRQIAAVASGTTQPGIEQGRGNPKQAPRLYLVLDGECALSTSEVDVLIERFPQLQQLCDECKEHYAQAVAQGTTLSQHHLDDLLYAFAVQYALGRLLMSAQVEPTAIIAQGSGVLAAACLLGLLNVKQAAEMLSRHALGHRELLDAVDAGGGERLERWHCPLLIPGFSLHARQDDASAQLAGYLQLPRALEAADLREVSDRDSVIAHLGGARELRQLFALAVPHARWIDLAEEEAVIARLLRMFARLYVCGVRYDSKPLAVRGARRVPLPTYPFENKPYRYVALADTAPTAVPPARVAPENTAPAPCNPVPAPAPALANTARLIRAVPPALDVHRRESLAAILRQELLSFKT